MVNAFRAGTVVAVMAAVVGWFMVLRRQSFAGHTLAVVSFPGAAAAIWLGISATAGYFAAGIAAALVIAMVPRSPSGRARSQESAVIGTVQAFALATGALFVSLYGGFLNSLTGLLFGTFLGISDSQVLTLAVVAVVVLVVLAFMARPLFFATVDSDVAAARRVPVRWLSVAFLVLMGGTAAEVSQITGALLVFALMVMPAAAAQQMTARPGLSLVLSVVLALTITWVSLGVAYYSSLSGRVLRFHLRLRGLRAGRRRTGARQLSPTPVAARAPRPSRCGGWRLTMATTVNPFVGIAHMLDHPFLRSAFIAGTCLALAAGLVGYVLVLRGQVFSADALSHVAFTGALAALAFGIDLRAGLYGACIVFAVLMAALGGKATADDTVIGSVFAWVLGLGALFLSVFTTSQSGTGGAGGNAGVNVLFGSILGLTTGQALADGVVALVVAALVVAIGRPVLFASLDPDVARARGVPVRALGYAFFIMLGVTTGVATQAVGALLLLGLLAAPAGAAQRLVSRPFAAMWVSAGIAVASVWIGLTIAYLNPRIPPSFGILAVSTGSYLLAFAATVGRRHRGGRTTLATGHGELDAV